MNYAEPLFTNEKLMMLAYDQGMEHGPSDLNEQNYDPKYILDIGVQGKYSCVAMQYGTASKFYTPEYAQQLPLVVKLNGKTSLGPKPLSVANATVTDAITIGASAVGFTIYLGSEYEADMIREFSEIRDQAHKEGLGVFAWMYPFITPPSSNDDELEADIVAYAARAGAELGADVVKIKYPHQPEKLKWIIENAVGTKAVLSGGDKASEEEFLGKVKNFMDAGGAGIAVGRNAWQHPEPLQLASKLYEVIFASA
jgi:class I fructose-bisphosphate aldolase